MGGQNVRTIGRNRMRQVDNGILQLTVQLTPKVGKRWRREESSVLAAGFYEECRAAIRAFAQRLRKSIPARPDCLLGHGEAYAVVGFFQSGSNVECD